MIENINPLLPISFIITSVLTLGIFYWVLRSSEDITIRNQSTKILIGLIVWLGIQAIISLNHIYSNDYESIPPRIFLLGVLPNILVIFWIFMSRSGRRFIDSLDIKKLTYLHVVRIPVELVLYWLFLCKLIPEILTFEGWNFDIIIGVTAPLIIYFGFTRGTLTTSILFLWNVIGIMLLFFVFISALLSAPSPLQQLAFDQPNIGLLYFPFSWLPTFIVPLVVFGHLISIRQLMKK